MTSSYSRQVCCGKNVEKNCSEGFYLLKLLHAQTKLAFWIKCTQLRQMGPSIKLPFLLFFPFTIHLNKKPLWIKAKARRKVRIKN